MESKPKYRRSAKQSTTGTRQAVPDKGRKTLASLPYSDTYAATLNQVDLSGYLYGIIKSNLPYYSALAKHISRPYRVPHNRRDYKNGRIRSRLTASALTILKTQFAKKPKNPV